MPSLTPGPRHAAWRPDAARYVALDVDGTLVGPDGGVSDEVVAACGRARDAGLHVGLATGRMALGVSAVLERTGIVGPHVLHNGAEVRLDGEIVAGTSVPMDHARTAIDLATTAGVYLEVYVEDGFVVTRDDPRAADHWRLLGHEPLAVVADGSALGDHTARVPKVTAIAFSPDEVDDIVALLTEAGLRAGPAGSPATPHLMYVNGTHPDANKGSALAAAAAVIGCTLAETVVAGDAGNDLPLLAAAGTAIAMGQAEDEVRDLAHLVAPAVTRDGAAVALDATVAGFAGLRPRDDAA